MKNWKTLAAAAAVLAVTTTPLYAADSAGKPTTLDADTVEYDMGSGLVTATGNVLMKQGDSKVTGARATYNHETQAGLVEGNVIAVHADMRLTCARVTTDGKGHMQATGDVYGTQQDKSFSGEQVDYYPNQSEYIVMEKGGYIKTSDGTFTAARLEGWLANEHYVGTGNAHVVSPARDIEAGGDTLDYDGKTAEGKAVLTGNAWATQGNNTLHSNRLTIYLAKDGKAAVQ